MPSELFPNIFPFFVFLTLIFIMIFYQNLVVCLLLWCLMFFVTFCFPKNILTQYMSHHTTFTHIQHQQHNVIIVSKKPSPVFNYQWLYYLKHLPHHSQTCLIITHGELWNDSLMFSLPRFIDKDCIFTPNIFQPQLSRPCHEINDRLPYLTCDEDTQFCHCQLTSPKTFSHSLHYF